MRNFGTRNERTERSVPAKVVRKFAPLIILGWLAITAVLSFCIPSLDQVAKERAVSLSLKDAPSVQAVMHIGDVFKESSTDSVAMVVLESDEPLGEDAHRYYEKLITQLSGDTTHIQHIQDYWGDPLTASAAQSPDGKAAYVQLSLAGNQGETLANESVDAVRGVVERTPGAEWPQGLCHRSDCPRRGFHTQRRKNNT